MSKKPIVIALETITPERAAADLEKAGDKNYRSRSEPRIAALAEAILHNGWDLNGETVKYNCDGKLIDGQHRFAAVVKADKPIKTYVAYNVPSDANIDTGRSRRFPSLLKHQGEIHTKELGGAVSWLWRYDHGGWEKNPECQIPHSELLLILKENSSIRESVALCISMIPRSIGMHAMFAACHFQFAKRDEEKARWFIEKLGTGVELSVNQPVRRLRERFEEDRTRKARLMTREKIALTIIAWNITRQEKPCNFLRWRASGPAAQEFPQIE